jgi:hypothetical protein
MNYNLVLHLRTLWLEIPHWSAATMLAMVERAHMMSSCPQSEMRRAIENPVRLHN